jgi:putative glutamine amidotransferase
MMHLSNVANRGADWAPVIGITASLKEDTEAVAQRPLGRFVRADLDYVEGVTEAGGVRVVLPPLAGPQAAKALLEGLDGLLLSGGSDLNPCYYGERPIPKLDVTIPERDAFEMALLRLALRRRVPVFGICRGMQVMNVALGGTLYQDLPSQLGSDVLKHQQDTLNWQPTHEVEVHEDSWVGRIIGACAKVNSYHHQGVKDLAAGLIASARSSDGVVEALESRDFSERWLVGVQWHPEKMPNAAPEHRSLFEAHVCAAERHALRRAAA